MPEVNCASNSPSRLNSTTGRSTKTKLPGRARVKKFYHVCKRQENCRSVFRATLAFDQLWRKKESASPGRAERTRSKLKLLSASVDSQRRSRPHFLLPQRRADKLSLVLLFPKRPTPLLHKTKSCCFSFITGDFPDWVYKYKHWGGVWRLCQSHQQCPKTYFFQIRFLYPCSLPF